MIRVEIAGKQKCKDRSSGKCASRLKAVNLRGLLPEVGNRKGELETYSDNTLSLLHRDLRNLAGKRMNGSELVYDYLVKGLGYGSLEEAEQAQKKNKPRNNV